MGDKFTNILTFINILSTCKTLDDDGVETDTKKILEEKLRIPVRLVLKTSNILSYHIDLRKELNLQIKQCLIFFVRATTDINMAKRMEKINDTLNNMRQAALKEGLAEKPHLIFLLDPQEDWKGYIEDVFAESYVSDAEGIKHLFVQIEPKKKMLTLLDQQGISTSGCPFHFLGPCSPDMFVGRKELIDEILWGSQSGFAITGGRRIGKTSLLLKLMSEAEKDDDCGYHPVYIDCSNVPSFESLAREITRRLYPKQYYRRKRPLNLKFEHIIGRGYNGKPTLLLLDEFDPLMKRIRDGKEIIPPLFYSIRTAANTSRTRLVVSGFRYISEMIHATKHPFQNLCEGKRLDLLSKGDVRKLITIPLLGRGITIEPKNEIINKICNLTAGHPSFVQFIAKKMFETRKSMTITPQDIQNVVSGKTFIEFILDFFVMNTSPFEKYICHLTSEAEAFSQDSILEKIDSEKLPVANLSTRIYYALKNLEWNNILLFDSFYNRYKFLYPAIQTTIKNYFFSPFMIKTIIKEINND